MKRIIPILIILILAVAGYALWLRTPEAINSSGKVHTELYTGAVDTWDAQMEILPFERDPAHQLTLHWTAPTQTYNNFVLTISTPDGNILRSESGEHDRLSLDPDGFEPDTQYIFALQACLDPRCEQWIISQQEYAGTTSVEQVPEDDAETPVLTID